jgi:hypothetical protein
MVLTNPGKLLDGCGRVISLAGKTGNRLLSQKMNDRNTASNDLERRILQGLASEWNLACSFLPRASGSVLRRPFFSLRGTKKRLGTWLSERREICLSRDFVLNHPWDSVREVLLHEMAHQYTDEVFNIQDQTPHGPAFREACRLFRANPEATVETVPLDVLVANGRHTLADTLLLRIRKLMALSKSSNPHEAEAAMTKAHQMIRRYNLDLLAHDEKRGFLSVFAGRPALRHRREDYHLGALLRDFYFVSGIWVPAYVIEKGKTGTVLELSGTVENLRIATYVHGFVQRFIESSWGEYRGRKRGVGRRRSDFAVGILEGLRSKLSAAAGRKAVHASARTLPLIRAGDPLLEAYMRRRYPRTIKVGGRSVAQDGGVVRDGVAVGKNLVIHNAITGESSTSGRLLTEG